MEETLFVNGVHGATGEYLEPLSLGTLADSGNKPEARLLGRVESSKGVFGLPYGVRPEDPTTVGWALVAHVSESDMIRRELAPLFVHRERTIGANVRFLTYGGQSGARWLAEHGVGGSDIDPTRVPYYLLLAGSAANIPFSFAHELALDYAVGRLELDAPEAYGRYAEQVVAHETRTRAEASRRVAFFAPRHDGATTLSADHLVRPLAAAYPGTNDIGATATKKRLSDILREPRDVLFTASHGVGFDEDDPRQRGRQGALLCQEWTPHGAMSEDFYYAGADIPADARLEGLISFHFACYGAGTPDKNRFQKMGAFQKRDSGPPRTLARTPFVSALAKEMLGRGALAVVSHVDRAWGFSIVSESKATQIAPFRNFLDHVLAGEPVGHAMRDFADRFANYAVQLTRAIEQSETMDVPEKTLVHLWTQRNDAEAYLVIGDPAVHL